MKMFFIPENQNLPDFDALTNDLNANKAKIQELEQKLLSYQDTILNKKEAAEFLGISISTIIRFMKDEKLRYYRAKGKVFFKKSEILEDMKNW